MLPQHIALVPTAGEIDPSDLARVGAALQRQVARDLAPLWGISASVAAFPALEDVPIGYWPILLTSEHAATHKAGRHVDENGQPFAIVSLASPHWSVEASRVCLELLVNPSGARTVPCASPRYDQGPVQVLLEICAPCADPSHAYAVHDVLVSDFCTPAFFTECGQDRYSFYGSISAPFQLLAGGHLIWFDPSSEAWWLRVQDEGEAVDVQLGTLTGGVTSVSDLARRYAPRSRRTWTLSDAAFGARAQLICEQAAAASRARAAQLRALLDLPLEARERDVPAPAPELDMGEFAREPDVTTREFSIEQDAVEQAVGPRERDAQVRDQHAVAPREQDAAPRDFRHEHSIVARLPVEEQPLASEPPERLEPVTLDAANALDEQTAFEQPAAVTLLGYPRPTTVAAEPTRQSTPPPLPSAQGSAAGAPSELDKRALTPARPPLATSSIAPTMSLVDEGRSRDGLDWRLLAAGAIVCLAVVAVIWRGRQPPMPAGTRASAAPTAAKIVSAPPAAAAHEASTPRETTGQQPPTLAAPAASNHPAQPAPSQARRRARTRPPAEAPASPLEQAPREVSVEELFDTRR